MSNHWSNICRTSINITIVFSTFPAYLKLIPVKNYIRAPPRYKYRPIKNKFPIKISYSFYKPTTLPYHYFHSV